MYSFFARFDFPLIHTAFNSHRLISVYASEYAGFRKAHPKLVETIEDRLRSCRRFFPVQCGECGTEIIMNGSLMDKRVSGRCPKCKSRASREFLSTETIRGTVVQLAVSHTSKQAVDKAIKPLENSGK